MKRLVIVAALVSFVTLADVSQAGMPGQVIHERSHIVYRQTGRPFYRRVYPGYEHGFPPPAMLYYGYPHSGYSYGMGF